MQAFEEFMAQALYHPERGYYTKHIQTIGTRGDFATSATLNPATRENLVSGIHDWILHELACHKKQGQPITHLIELGGGDGSLAQALLKKLDSWKQKLRGRGLAGQALQYNILDISEPLQTQQRQKLRKHNVTWHRDIQSALAETQGQAILFGNEFIDAFPCQIWRHEKAQGWQKLYLQQSAAQGMQEWQEQWQNQAPQDSVEDWQAYQAFTATEPPTGRIEIASAYHDWFQQLNTQLKRGSLLQIDYGDTYPELYHRRPQGTLRAYHMHQRQEPPQAYQNPGRKDLTHDVNFTDLIHLAENAGWKCQLAEDEMIPEFKWMFGRKR